MANRGEVSRLLAAFNPKPLEGEFLKLFYLPRRRPDQEFISYLRSGSHMMVIGDQGFGKTTTVNYFSEVALSPDFEPIRVQALYLADVLFQASVRALRRLASLYKGVDDYISFNAGEKAQELELDPSLRKMVSYLLWVNEESPVRFVVLVDNFSLMRQPSLAQALRALDVVMQHPQNLLIALFTTVEEHVRLGKKYPPLASKLTPVFMPHFSLEDTIEIFRKRTSWALEEDTLKPFSEEDVRAVYSSTSRIRDAIKLARLALERHLRDGLPMNEAVRRSIPLVLGSELEEKREVLDEIDRLILEVAREAVRPSLMKDYLAHKGYSLPDGTLFYRIKRLMERGLIERVGRGVYRTVSKNLK